MWQWHDYGFGAQAPNGQVLGNQGPHIDMPLRYAGQYADAETGLFYNWHRYYDPETGRYVQSDPIGLAGGLNTYIYAYDAPTNYIDPDGLNPLLGALSGAGVDIALQLAFNGGRIKCINWDVVAIAAVAGVFNPFSILNGANNFFKAERLAIQANKLRKGSRASKRKRYKAEALYRKANEEVAHGVASEIAVEAAGNLIPEKYHVRLNSDGCGEPCK